MHKTPFLDLVERINREDRIIKRWIDGLYSRTDVSAMRKYGCASIELLVAGQVVACTTVEQIEFHQKLHGYSV